MTPGTKQIILAGAPKTLFEADLKTSLVPGKAINGTPTFTRASAATVVDFEGLVKTVKSGEARFHGARRVENLITYSEDLSNAAWTKVATTTITGTKTAVFPTNVGDKVQYSFFAGVNLANRKFVARIKVNAVTNAASGIFFQMVRTSGTSVSSNVTVTTPGIYSITFTPLSDTSGFRFDFGLASSTNAGGSVTIDYIQIEEATGQADQNPSEYVSTGVLSAPYHGANVDGVKYFDYQNGNTVSSNVVTEARGAAISDSTLRGYLAEEQRINLWLSSGDITNTTYWTRDNTNDSYTGGIITESATGGNTYHGVTIPSGQRPALTLNTNYTASFLFTTGGTRRYVVVGSGGGNDGFGVTVDTQNWTITETAAGASAGAYVSSSIKQLSSTTYLVTVTGKHTATTGATAIIRGTTGATGNGAVGLQYTGDGSTIKVSSIQIELGSMATSYIPTTTATVTRAADVLNYTATNVNNDTGAVTADTYINWSGSPTSNATLIGIGSGTTAGLQISTSDSPTVIRMNDGTNAITKTGLDDASTGIRRRGAMWGSKGLYSGGNGLVSTQGTFDGLVEFSTINIGQLNGSLHLNGTIRNVKVYQKQMTLTLFTRRVIV